ncbi:MAG: SDR family oxidoreductase [Thermodesulfobacteriota bacterium]|nr:SDR family oxidoreductase [Thermodesulfobacteriota bacterium]
MESSKTIRIFDGATGIVTGGASGIGRALAEELAKRGCEVVLADLQIELAEEVASEIRLSGGKATAVKIEVTDFSAMEQLVQETINRTGRLDYIFNNAGIAIGGNVCHYGIEDWNQIVDVNLRGVINGVQAAYKIMMAQGFGHIVNTASMAGLMVSPGAVAYATTKYGVVGLSLSLRAEAAQMGARVSVLCPGVVRTPILEGMGKYGKMLIDIPPEQMRRMWEKLKPMPPNMFAEKVLNSVASNKAIIIVPSWWKLFWWMNRLSPSLGISLAQRRFQKVQKELGIVQKS